MEPSGFGDLAERAAQVRGARSSHLGACRRLAWALLAVLLTGLLAQTALAHGVDAGDANYLKSKEGFFFWPYFYLGAKHMVTGYDHLLFLAGVIFFLYRLRDVGLYVTLFAIGHSLTLVAGVWFDVPANAHLIDAIIGLSVVYKAFENLGGFRAMGWLVDTRLAVWIFGLFHGFGLATKLQELGLSAEGLLPNLLAFNLGVEFGQIAALVVILALMNLWRYAGRDAGGDGAAFARQAIVANCLLMSAGFALIGFQLTGYFVAAPG